ncbi:MAG: hypothetical protein AAFN12_19995, partial [Cyanobacteria bacterium J06560_2]
RLLWEQDVAGSNPVIPIAAVRCFSIKSANGFLFVHCYGSKPIVRQRRSVNEGLSAKLTGKAKRFMGVSLRAF